MEGNSKSRTGRRNDMQGQRASKEIEVLCSRKGEGAGEKNLKKNDT